MSWSEYMLSECGYKTKTTFWMDFSIADRFGVKAIKDTFKRAFEEWKDDVEYVIELVLVLNHKMFQYNDKNSGFVLTYQKLFEKANGWCLNHLKGDDLNYFLHVTD